MAPVYLKSNHDRSPNPMEQARYHTRRITDYAMPGVPGDNLEKFSGVERGASCLHAESQSANKFSRPIFIHFFEQLVERISSKAFSLEVMILSILIT